MTRNVRRNLQLRLKVARNAKQKHQQPSKVEINAKQFVQRLPKWQETQNNAHFLLQGRYCLAFLSILGLKRRNCLAFPDICDKHKVVLPQIYHKTLAKCFMALY